MEWKRFWYSRGEDADPHREEGFLRHPESGPSRSHGPKQKTLEQLADIPCLVLLGEPGIGKSDTIRRACARGAGELIDLAGAGSADLLFEELQERPAYRRWRDSKEPLTLFFDSLDEGSLDIDHLGTVLLRRMGPVVQGLKLRVACRTAVWPANFGVELRDTFGSVDFRILAPLGPRDVRLCAEQRLGSERGRAFCQALRHLRLHELASRPITLLALLEQYAEEGALAASRGQLYERAIDHLASEVNTRRRESLKHPVTGAPRQRQLAAPLAAVSLLTGRRRFSRGLKDRGDRLTVDQISSLASELGFPASRNDIIAVLDTGLFAGDGDCVTWAHATFAEVLAGQFLQSRGLPGPQLEALLLDPTDRGVLIPALRGLAGWLAVRSPSAFEIVIDHDPWTVLGADPTMLTDTQRKRLLDAILSKAWGRQGWDLHREHRASYRGAVHPNIVEQLASFLSKVGDDLSVDLLRCQIIVALAVECCASGLLPHLLEVALDRSRSGRIRALAVDGIRSLGKRKHRRALRDILAEDRSTDESKELFAAVVGALFPADLTTDTLLAALPPPSSTLWGRYSMLLANLASRIPEDGQGSAIEWAGRQDPHDGQLGALAEAILARAIRLEADVHVPALGKAAWRQIARHRDPVPQPLLSSVSADRRVALAAAVIEQATRPDAPGLAFRISCILGGAEGVMALLRRACGSPLTVRERYVPTVCWLGKTDDPRVADAALTFLWQVKEEGGIEGSLIRAVVLDSEEARTQQQRYRDDTEASGERARSIAASEGTRRDFRNRFVLAVRSALARLAAGDLDAWLNLTELLNGTPKKGLYSGMPSSVRELLWSMLGKKSRNIALDGALAWLEAHHTPPAWDGDGAHVPCPIVGAWRAFMLLAEVAPRRLRQIPPESWRAWMPAVLRLLCVQSTGTEDVPVGRWFNGAVRADSGAFRSAVLLALGDWDDDGKLLDALDVFWRPAFRPLVEAAARRALADARADRHLYEVALRRGIDLIDGLANAVRERSALTDTFGVASAIALLSARPEGWAHVREVFWSDPAFGSAAVLALAESGRMPPHPEMSVAHAADLLFWLLAVFPPASDPEWTFHHGPFPRREIADLRWALRQDLSLRDQPAAVLALRKIAEHTGDAGVTETLREAEAATLAATWSPPAPEDVVRLLENPRHRLIRTEGDLLRVVLEALDDIETSMSSGYGDVSALWNRPSSRSICEPKEENDLSDFVAERLKQRLEGRRVVINREVQVQKGQETDIKVEASEPGGGGVAVIIEVKGCWNTECRTSMEGQLGQRYLSSGVTRHGVYLVGWFDCPQWNSKDYRRHQRAYSDLGEARRACAEQAQELSRPGRWANAAKVLDCRLPANFHWKAQTKRRKRS